MEEKKEIVREFGLSTYSVKNRTTIVILTIIMAVFGLMSYIGMPKELYPEIVMPTVYINTIYPGNSPVDIENLITRPIEKEMKSIQGIKKIQSTSAQDVSAVIIEFNEDVVISDALNDVKEGIDKAKKNLPTDLENDPVATELDFSQVPVVVINISGDFEISKLKEYAEFLQDEIELLPQVSKVDITGALDREVQINADPYKMEAMKVSFGDIEKAIANENMTISGGDILMNGYRRAMRVSGEFKSVSEIESVIVKSEDLKTVFVRDVAEVKDSYVERKSYARLSLGKDVEKGGQPVVSLLVKKRSGSNLIEAAVEIDKILAKAQSNKLPKNLNIELTNDQSRNIKMQISNLENSIISGVILVVGVLLFFMGLRNANIVGLAIPMSMLLSFIILNVMGVTLNMVVLFSLILALGMLVDNAIVVVENTYRLHELGMPLKRAAIEGVGEVAIPIIGSTATTVAAFIPLAFWGGILGEFMKYLPITLIVVLTSSLFVGLVINPVVAMMFMKLENNKGEKKEEKQKKLSKSLLFSLAMIIIAVPLYFMRPTYTLPNIFMTVGLLGIMNTYILTPAANFFQNKMLVRLEKGYLNLLRYALTGKRPYFFFFSMFPLLIGSVILVGIRQPKVSLFPDNEPLEAYVYVEMPQGTDVKTTNEMVLKVEKRVAEILQPYKSALKSLVVNVGEGAAPVQGGLSMGPSFTPHRGKITMNFVEFQFRGDVSTSEVLKKVSLEVKKIPGAKITTEKRKDGPPVGKPVSIEVTGDDYVTLLQEAEKIKAYIDAAKISGIDKLELEAEVGKPELILNIDREKAQKFGLSTVFVAATLRNALFGKEVSKFKEKDEDYPIQLRFEEKYRYDLQALMNQKITFRDNKGKWHQVPVASVADIQYSSSFGAVKRKNLDKLVVVSSNILEGYNANEIVTQIKTMMKAYKMKEGYNFRFGGEQEEQAKSMAFLTRALLIALAAVFMIIVWQFNSAIRPAIIMISVLLSTIGVFLGLAIFKMDFVIIMTGIGIISLAGVVVNNAIVLIDYTDLLKNRKLTEQGLTEDDDLEDSLFIDALVEAGYTRLRPVLLTAITTVLGLIPLATGMNIDFFLLYEKFDPDFYVGGDNAIFWGPMAWTVIFGLTFATFLTLVIVPVMYLLVDRMNKFFKKIFA